MEKFDVTIKNGYSIILAGPSKSGKTTWVKSLLSSELLEQHPTHIFWVSSTAPPRIEQKLTHLQNLDDLVITGDTTLVVIDDLMQEACSNEKVQELFTKRAHHDNISVILILQNLFASGRYTRTITQNAQYLVYFKNPRDNSVISSLGRQMYPYNSKFLTQAYRHATKKPYGYIFIDMSQSTPEHLRIRSDIFEQINPVYWH